jgi:hypothetical protein
MREIYSLRKKVIALFASAVFSLGIFFGVVFSHGTSSLEPYLAPKVLYSLDEKRNDEEIISVIDSAHEYVHFAIYTFTKKNIADALVHAHVRGVDVKGITDRGQSTISSQAPILNQLRSAGISVETQKHDPGIMHIKALVTENAYVSGSYNWTGAATTYNDEVLEIGTDRATHDAYKAIIEKVINVNGTGAATQSASVINGLVATSSSSAGSISISFDDAPQYVNQQANVSGVLDHISRSKSGTVFLNFCKDYKGCPFEAVIFKKDAANFKNLDAFVGKTVIVAGTISSYQGQVEIVLSSPDQISVSVPF